jgi:L,D-peptidoglycan transpeptidase YkuD (ErfK/YbiS/YcfS/YnhG family)
MIKSFLILISLSNLLFSSQQIILVVAKEMNSTKAKLECYEDGKKIFGNINVNLGFNGLAWGIGEVAISDTTEKKPIKKEGDKRAPAGIFQLQKVFGYSQTSDTKMPYLYADKSLICVDDQQADAYNAIIHAQGDEKSFEYMRRDDNLYKYGVVVGHNKKAKKGYGSCIFLHIQRSPNAPTLGCTSMEERDIKKIVQWLDPHKHPLLIQVPKSAASRVLRHYPALQKSQLFKEKD